MCQQLLCARTLVEELAGSFRVFTNKTPSGTNVPSLTISLLSGGDLRNFAPYTICRVVIDELLDEPYRMGDGEEESSGEESDRFI